jgi:hypothetical protein
MRRALPSVLCLLLWASVARAQTLQQSISDLFVFGDCGQPLCLDLPDEHGAHFLPAIGQGQNNLIGFVGNAVGVTVSNVPISAATSGAIWGRSAAGLPMRTATSAGPIFAERAQTLGRGHVLFGVNVSNFDFTTIRGTPLSDLVFDFTHQDTGDDNDLGSPLFEDDVLEVRTDLNVNLFAATGLITYGLLDAVDIGVAVPLVHTSIDGTSFAQMIPADPTVFHHFGTPANPSLTAQTTVNNSASGIGDVAARVKVQVAEGNRVGAALMGEVRFPTGKEEDLLGSGEYAARGVGILSARYGNFTPHANVGYLYRGGELQNDAVLATVGFDHLLAKWATFAADVISELQVGASKSRQPDPVVLNTPVGGASSTRTVTVSNIPDRPDDVVLGSFGFKFNSANGVVVVTNALLPIHRGYLQPDVAWTLGLEYTF